MEEVVLAHKYARALISAAQGANLIERMDRELAAMEMLLEKCPQLRESLASPLIAIEEKRRLLEDIFKGRQVLPEVANFLLLLIKARRFSLCGEICRIYKDLIYTLRKRLKVFVESAFAVEPAQKQTLKEKLTKIYQRNIDLFVRVNPALIGGMRIFAGHTRYDGTVQAQLELLREKVRAESAKS